VGAAGAVGAAGPAAAGQPQPLGSPGQHLAEARYVVRQGNRATIDIEGGVRWERLTPQTMPHLDFFELVYGPGAESNPTLYSHPGTEMVLMLTGSLDISVGFETYRLAPGDSMEFPSSLPHRYANPGHTEARAVTVIMYDCPAGGPAPTAAPVHR
jgi:quercetin dioxygenase-like cupin family protein